MQTKDPAHFFANRADSYSRFIKLAFYQQGLQGYFQHSPYLCSGQKVLDAGCGTGAVTVALHKALLARCMTPGQIQGFDLTEAMLDRFHVSLRQESITGIEIVRADVLHLESLPTTWNNYDLIVSASMLEYVPRDQFVNALRGLRCLLRDGGRFILFITKRNWLTRPLIGWWWASNLYTADELRESMKEAGFEKITFGKFPLSYKYLASWGNIVEATRQQH